MQKRKMKIGRKYEMQRGPTKRPRLVTLLGLEAPSGATHRVLVRIEEGIGKGREIEAPCQSIFALPDQERHLEPVLSHDAEERLVTAPLGWRPVKGKSVGWSRIGGGCFRVLSVDPSRKTAQIKGEVLGVIEEYEAPIAELAPHRQPRLSLVEEDLNRRLRQRLPEIPPPVKQEELPSPKLTAVPAGDDWIDDLVFSPKCLRFYRQRFAKDASLEEAERRLRDELRSARKVRLRRRTDEYLRLRVKGRFDAILKESPTSGSDDAVYIDGLRLFQRRRAA
jgi:hypothetical protein